MKTALTRRPTFALVYSSFKVHMGTHSCASLAFPGPSFATDTRLVFARPYKPLPPDLSYPDSVTEQLGGVRLRSTSGG